MQRKVDLILDSGAFSAWNRGGQIDIDAYCEYVKAREHLLFAYVNLDVIPGKPFQKPSPDQVELAAAEGWKNLLHMEARGLKPMPVYHQGERLSWLEKMIATGHDYIGISPANDKTPAQRAVWLDDVFTFLCKENDGYPCIKTHGFGVTTVSLLFRYPWYSVDSMSWVRYGGYGYALVPAWGKDGYDFTRSPECVAVSDRPPLTELKRSRHIDLIGAQQQEYILRYFEHEGFSLDVLRTSPYERQRLACRFFLHVEKTYKPRPFRVAKNGGFFT